jgi:hypothetical protein
MHLVPYLTQAELVPNRRCSRSNNLSGPYASGKCSSCKHNPVSIRILCFGHKPAELRITWAIPYINPIVIVNGYLNGGVLFHLKYSPGCRLIPAVFLLIPGQPLQKVDEHQQKGFYVIPPRGLSPCIGVEPRKHNIFCGKAVLFVEYML